MWRRTSALLTVLLMVGTMALALVATPRASGAGAEIIIGPDETLEWVGENRTLDGRVTVLGRLDVRDCNLTYNITTSGDASLWVRATGVVTFANTTLFALNHSAYFFLKVEGVFEARDCALFHLSGSYYSGGGVKCVGGRVDLRDTNVTDCESMAVSVEGDSGSAVIERCYLQGKQYGITAKDGASISVRNTTIDGFTNMGVTVSNATSDLLNCVIRSNVGSNVAKGFGARSAHVDISGTTVSNCKSDAVELVENTTGEVKGCEFHNCTVGLRMTGITGDLRVWSCRIHNNLDGINMYQSSGVVIEQCTLTRNINGVASKDCDGGYTLRNNMIADNAQLGCYVVNDGFSEEGTTWSTPQGLANYGGRLRQMWTLDLQVTDRSGKNVSGAEVTVRIANGTIINYTTNSFGVVAGGIVLEGYSITNNGTRIDAPGYKVTIKLGLVEAKKTVVMDRHKTLTVILGEAEKISPLRTPLGIATIALIILAIICGAAYWYLRWR